MEFYELVPLCVVLLGAGAYFQRLKNRIEALEKRVDQLGNKADQPRGDLLGKAGIIASVLGIAALVVVVLFGNG